MEDPLRRMTGSWRRSIRGKYHGR